MIEITNFSTDMKQKKKENRVITQKIEMKQ